MSSDTPALFALTARLRERYREASAKALDLAIARNYNTKVLCYILRCMLGDHTLYHKEMFELRLTPDATKARFNFARLLKQCDILDQLPRSDLGIICHSYPMNVLPIPPAQFHSQKRTSRRQRDRIVSLLNDSVPKFAVYTSNFGITNAISLPTLSIVLPNLSSTPSARIIKDIAKIPDAFDFEAPCIRYSIGHFAPVGQIFYYPRVPIGASISPSDDYVSATARTLGCFCKVNGSVDYHMLTAGHVAVPDPNVYESTSIFAPAAMPFAEAKKSLLSKSQGNNRSAKTMPKPTKTSKHSTIWIATSAQLLRHRSRRRQSPHSKEQTGPW
jgi:hypothetical protein